MVGLLRCAFTPFSSFILIILASMQFCLVSGTIAEARSLKTIADNGQLLVGVDIPYGVMEFYAKNGKPSGIDIDIAREIATGLGVEVKFSAMPFDNLFKALHQHKVDLVLSAVTITAERQKTLLFSAPYLSASTVFAVKKSEPDIASIKDLKNGKLGVLKGTLGEKLAHKHPVLKSSTIVQYMDNKKRIADLVAGKLDAAIVHFLVKSDLPIKIIGPPLRQNFYGVVAEPKNVRLMAEVDKILRAMKRDGRLMSIKNKYIK